MVPLCRAFLSKVSQKIPVDAAEPPAFNPISLSRNNLRHVNLAVMRWWCLAEACWWMRLRVHGSTALLSPTLGYRELVRVWPWAWLLRHFSGLKAH